MRKIGHTSYGFNDKNLNIPEIPEIAKLAL